MRIEAILLHPIKGLDSVRVEAARVLASGALELDRRWALVDKKGRFVNGKNRPAIHKIRAAYDVPAREVALDGEVFSLDREGPAIADWFAYQLGEPMEWREDATVGFPDDLVSPGPTFVSTPSVETVATWFGLEPEAAARRFRSNVQFDAPEPFWEDRLYGSRFQAGEVEIEAVNPCQRCVVPSRNALTGVQDHGFQKRFAELREAHLPAFAQRSGFSHFYRFAVNTRITPGEAGKTLRVGDSITLL